MHINFRTFFLKSIPYLMSIAGGIVLYTGAIDNAPNENIRDLVINVSASLLSIPLVFLLYDYTNSRVARQMRLHLENSVSDRLNSVMINLISVLRGMLGLRSRLTPDALNRMLVLRAPDIIRRLNITPRHLSELQACHSELDTLLYRNASGDVLTPDQVQILSSIARAITHLVSENKFHHNRHLNAKYTEILLSRILDWLDTDSILALNLQSHLPTSGSVVRSGKSTRNKNKA